MTLSFLCPAQDAELREVLHKALIRSFTRGQIHLASEAQFQHAAPGAWVVANAPDAWAECLIKHFTAPGSKILLLGRIPARLADHLGIEAMPLPDTVAADLSCAPAQNYHHSRSAAVIRYDDTESRFGIISPISERPLLRYDFADEWNNLGYGAIRADASIWALAQKVQGAGAHALADIEINGNPISHYAALWKNKNSSLLWFNRPAGPVDSQEWRLVERYFSSYGYPGVPCLPVLQEVPHGFDAAVTMRLDCDEDIISAERLFSIYVSEHIPFSLALTTRLLEDPKHLPLLRSVIAGGGSLLTHSATHPVNWGGDYANAHAEVTVSRHAIHQALSEDIRIDYAVSPFHQNPPYAIKAMADAGLKGFVGGIIRNDPEYLLARGGEVPWGAEGFVSHSQQCMLHGDCMLAEGDPLALYKRSFDIAFRGGALFGYLDHPFSPRYQYGWLSEEQRMNAHRDFIAYMRSRGTIVFLSEKDALDWIRYKASATIVHDQGNIRVASASGLSSPWTLQLELGGKRYAAEEAHG